MRECEGLHAKFVTVCDFWKGRPASDQILYAVYSSAAYVGMHLYTKSHLVHRARMFQCMNGHSER